MNLICSLKKCHFTLTNIKKRLINKTNKKKQKNFACKLFTYRKFVKIITELIYKLILYNYRKDKSALEMAYMSNARRIDFTQ